MYNPSLPFTWWTEDQRLCLIRQVRSKIHELHLGETGTPPPQRFLRIRSLSTILHAIGASWTDNLQHIAASWRVSGPEEILYLAAEKIYTYKQQHFPDTTLRSLSITTWNVSSLRDPYSEVSEKKIAQLRKLTSKSICLLQETKWKDTQEVLLHSRLPTVRILSSNAVQVSKQGEAEEESNDLSEHKLSGGIAILLPTYIWHSTTPRMAGRSCAWICTQPRGNNNHLLLTDSFLLLAPHVRALNLAALAGSMEEETPTPDCSSGRRP